MKASSQPERGSSFAPRPLFLYALIFCAIFALHAPVLRLPYFWDEAGYFVPAARDLMQTGDPIAHTTLSNAHPPLVMAWLALWWKLSNYTPAVTRTAMLLVAALALLAVWELARRVANTKVAAAAVILTAIYPVFFAQSSLAHLDIPAAALSLWAVYFHVTDRRWASMTCVALACLSKETCVVTPLTFVGWELVCYVGRRTKRAWAERWCLHCPPLHRSLMLLLALVPLAAWYAYHWHRTGFVLGNPEYLRYNLGATMSPLRILLAAVQRFWQGFGYMNLFVLTIPALFAMRSAPVVDREGERHRIDVRVQIIFGLLVLTHIVEFAVLGGAVLARYMLPVVPLVIIVSVSTLYRRLQDWKLWVAISALAFLLALVISPPWRISPEDNLSYSDFVRLHKQAATIIEKKYSEDRILTAWPASDELNRPFLGYVQKPLTVVRVENFTLPQIMRAAQQPDAFDVAFVFSTKYEPPRNFMARFGWWTRIQERYFDFHQDVRPDVIAEMLHGRIVWQSQMGGEWAAIIEVDKIRNAELRSLDIGR